MIHKGDLVQTNYFGRENQSGVVVDVFKVYGRETFTVLLSTGELQTFSRDYLLTMDELGVR